MSQADVAVQIQYNNKELDKSFIKTNLKPEAIEEILSEWVRSQMGAGKDTSEPNQQIVYNITILLDLSCDNFSTSSDTGNKSLTCGIVMWVLKNLDTIEVLDL